MLKIKDLKQISKSTINVVLAMKFLWPSKFPYCNIHFFSVNLWPYSQNSIYSSDIFQCTSNIPAVWLPSGANKTLDRKISIYLCISRKEMFWSDCTSLTLDCSRKNTIPKNPIIVFRKPIVTSIDSFPFEQVCRKEIYAMVNYVQGKKWLAATKTLLEKGKYYQTFIQQKTAIQNNFIYYSTSATKLHKQ